MEFKRDADCKNCQLWELSENPCIPTRAADWNTGRQKALVVIGQNPGYNEDKNDKSWIGQAGIVLNKLLRELVEIEPLADVYLANIARCRTPENRAPNVTARRRCWPHLQVDLEAIVTKYGEENVTILGLGAPAIWALTGLSIKRSVLTNGCRRKLHLWRDGPAFTCFFTYHPASAFPGRDPSLRAPMNDHLLLMKGFFHGNWALPKLPPMPSGPLKELPPNDGIIGLDIETYGCLAGVDQTSFHPARMSAVDKVSKSRMITRVCLGWFHDSNRTRIDTATYNFQRPEEIRRFVAALGNLPPTTTIVGHNVLFDVGVLRYCIPALARLFRIGRFNLDDTVITNHLDSDMRPEKSLKAISRLFRAMDYDAIGVDLSEAGLGATGPTDPNLILYNAADVIATLKHWTKTLASIEHQHGAEAPALSDYGRQFRSDVLWMVLHMSEAGIPFDRQALQALHTKTVADAARYADEAYAFGEIIHGKGSQKSIRTLIYDAITEAGLIDDERLELTKVTKDISTGKKNIHLLLGALSMDAKTRPRVQLVENYRKAEKLVSTYTSKLLFEPVKGLVGDIAYPSWFVVPGHVKDSSSAEGGTRQGRFSAKNPAIQTAMKVITACMNSRYGDDGILAAYDESQIELRTAALWSGDPVMMESYILGLDNHLRTAQIIWPDLVAVPKGHPDYKMYRNKRQIGKRTNFLTLYLGGAEALVASIRMDIGYELPMKMAHQIIAAFDEKHHVFRAWQRKTIKEAGRQGYCMLLTGWKRTFLGAEDAVRTYANEMANVPIQGTAAQCVQSSQIEILKERQRRRLVFMMEAQIHDSVIVDVYKASWAAVDELVVRHLTHPPMWHKLEKMVGREVPLVVDRTILYTGRNARV